jgi:hypothetical protein
VRAVWPLFRRSERSEGAALEWLFDGLLVGHEAQATDDHAEDDDGFRRQFQHVLIAFESNDVGGGEVAARQTLRVAFDLRFDYDQIARNGLDARVDSHGIARNQAEARQGSIADPERVVPRSKLRIPTEGDSAL